MSKAKKPKKPKKSPGFLLYPPFTRKSLSKQFIAELKLRQATLAKERDEMQEVKELLEDLIEDADSAVMHIDDAIAVLSKFQ